MCSYRQILRSCSSFLQSCTVDVNLFSVIYIRYRGYTSLTCVGYYCGIIISYLGSNLYLKTWFVWCNKIIYIQVMWKNYFVNSGLLSLVYCCLPASVTSTRELRISSVSQRRQSGSKYSIYSSTITQVEVNCFLFTCWNCIPFLRTISQRWESGSDLVMYARSYTSSSWNILTVGKLTIHIFQKNMLKDVNVIVFINIKINWNKIDFIYRLGFSIGHLNRTLFTPALM